MRYRLMATYRGVPYEAGVGPADGNVVLFAACPPPEDLGFEPATGHWRKEISAGEVQALWESRPTGRFRGDRCMVLDDLGDRLHIAYIGHDAYRAEQLGYWEVDRGVFEMIAPREEVTEIAEERAEFPRRPSAPRAADHPSAPLPATSAAALQHPSGPLPGSQATAARMSRQPGPGRDLDALRAPRALRDTGSLPGSGEPRVAALPLEEAARLAASARREATEWLADRGPEPAWPTGPEPAWPLGLPQTGLTQAQATAPQAGLPQAQPTGPQAGLPQAGPPHAGPPQAGPPQAAPPQAGPPQAAPPQAGPPQAAPPQAAPPQAGPPQAGPPQAGPPQAGPRLAQPTGPQPVLPAALQQAWQPGAQASPAAVGATDPRRSRRRDSARRDLATRQVFSELAGLAAIPPSAFAVGEEVDGAMCLIQTADRFEVFNAADGNRHEVRVFDEEESAYFYLFGVLAAEAVRTGRLAPQG